MNTLSTIFPVLGNKFSGGSTCIIKGGWCVLSLEVTAITPITHGDVILSELPIPALNLYLFLGASDGKGYTASIGLDGKLIVYFPTNIDISRVDTTICYPIHT